VSAEKYAIISLTPESARAETKIVNNDGVNDVTWQWHVTKDRSAQAQTSNTSHARQLCSDAIISSLQCSMLGYVADSQRAVGYLPSSFS